MKLFILYTYSATVEIEVTEEQYHNEDYVSDMMNTLEPTKDKLNWVSTETIDEHGNPVL